MVKALLTAIVANLLLVATASAHYLWLAVDREAGEQGTANLYFEEGPRAGDGKYLDPFVEHGKMWIRTLDDEKPVVIEMNEVKEKGKRWLSAKLPAAGPRSVDSYGKWGVYTYGKKEVLLHYHAKAIEFETPGQLAELGRAEHLNIDIVPAIVDDEVEFQVLWKGKAAADRPVYIRGPKGFRKNLKTNKDGKARLAPSVGGQYLLRTYVEEPDKSGTDGGKKYDLVRHHCTLTVTLSPGTTSK